ncbi:hypothetical protein C8R46DRAFT_1091478 [Mycena filopes]|nr:hypothetical protein C8R46DRAFT_1091478 [Mycena filopes]
MAPPKEPTRQQLSSRLQYSANTPRFLQKLQNRIAGVPDEDDYDDEGEYGGGEYEPDDGSGRVPIPRRPAIPERPDDDPGSADEDQGDERPQVVVLREKHLTEREAENVRRQERGLPPLPDPAESASKLPPDASETKDKDKAPAKPKTAATPSLSFSSTKNGFKAGAAKRKAALIGSKADGSRSGEAHPPKKKAKKESKTLLSFGDDA